MKILTAKFVKSAVKPEHYPPEILPEFAFAGKSNVGKSSLINTLVNRKRLVKTSGVPGRTQLLNFFDINDEMTFVDLPGYGYARVPVSVKKDWGKMIETYLSTRKTLKCVVVILDIRRTPGTGDADLIDWLRYHDIPYIPVLTKADKLSNNQCIRQRARAARILSIDREDLPLFSAKTRLGMETLWKRLLSFLP